VRLRDWHALPLTSKGAPVDLNYLYHRRGISLFMSQNAACERSRAAHLGLVGGYAARIAEAKRRLRRPGLSG